MEDLYIIACIFGTIIFIAWLFWAFVEIAYFCFCYQPENKKIFYYKNNIISLDERRKAHVNKH